MSRYTYNSLGQLTRQTTPDGGTTDFYYNRRSQLRYSQNDKQRNAQGGGNDRTAWFSYTRYDELGRVTEVGESNQVANLEARREEMGFPNAGFRQVTRTTYSQPGSVLYSPNGQNLPQRYLQNRVSFTTLDPNPAEAGDEQTTTYSYDPHGNVEWLVQSIPGLGQKAVRYEYDLIAGKVLRVNYQEGTLEQFYHRYQYDEDNRLTGVETSTDGVIWDKDARYAYYRHGPLQQQRIGEDGLQQLDYTYTIHGWLKAINGQTPTTGQPTTTPTGPPAAPFPADVFRMSLGYYAGDYQRQGIGQVETALNPAPDRSLYNGNIATWSRFIAPAGSGLSFNGQLTSEQFRYDELNRLTFSSFRSLTGPASAANAYSTRYGYDANGNLLDLRRYNAEGKVIDNLHYRYAWLDAAKEEKLLANRLGGVGDERQHPISSLPAVGNATDLSLYGTALARQRNNNMTSGDVANQPIPDNYAYDEIGNLTADQQDKIQIEWTVYGKVKSVVKTDGSQRINIDYAYDAAGNRTVKRVETTNLTTNAVTSTISTYYVRDAQGNVLSVYDNSGNGGRLSQKELYLYGSSRLGVARYNTARSLASGELFNRSLNLREYELTDHLGNVRAVIGDGRETPLRAALKSYYNYYAFGMQMPGMSAPALGYRYGYNGKEQDRDFANNYDYGFRIYNAGIGKFLSVDPLTENFPTLTPYQFSANNPVAMVDLDGLEAATVNPNTEILVFILQGYGGNPPNGKTQADNAGGDLGKDEALGSIYSTGPKMQIVHYASSSTDNTKNDVLSTIKNFRTINQNGKVVIIGHSGGGDNAIELAKDNSDVKINLLITLDTQDPKIYGIDDNNIPSNVKNAINYYQTTEAIGGETIDFSDQTNGINVNSPGSNHRSIDNDQLNNVISDINNFAKGKDPVKIAKDRKQPIYNPANSNSPDVFGPNDTAGKIKGTVNPKSTR